MATTLRPALDVMELPPEWRKQRTHLPSIRQFVSEYAAEYENDLLMYLSQGAAIVVSSGSWLGYDLLRLPEEKVRIGQMPVSLLRHDGDSAISPTMAYTDGMWFWYGALVYYVKEYHVRLDPAFVLHAKTANWAIDWEIASLSDFDCSNIWPGLH